VQSSVRGGKDARVVVGCARIGAWLEPWNVAGEHRLKHLTAGLKCLADDLSEEELGETLARADIDVATNDLGQLVEKGLS
jgi:hypothetical protein